jgi:inosose dehydratase
MIDRHHPTRRAFLQSSTAALSLAALPKLFAEEKKTDDFGGFTLGAQTYTFRHFDLEPALKKIKELGLTSGEFYSKHIPLDAKPAQLEAILKLCKDYDVKPVSFGVQHFTKDHDANKKVFEFGKALGLKAFSASPDPDSFDSLDKLCDEYKIAVGIHPHGPVGAKAKEMLDRWYSAEVILNAVKNHHKLIGSCLDTGHLIRAAQLGKKLDPAQEIRTMGDRNFGIHLKDHDNDKHTDVIFGQGVLDVTGVLKALRDVKFAYAISIEYEAKEDNPSDDVKQCVAVFKESVKKLS